MLTAGRGDDAAAAFVVAVAAGFAVPVAVLVARKRSDRLRRRYPTALASAVRPTRGWLPAMADSLAGWRPTPASAVAFGLLAATAAIEVTGYLAEYRRPVVVVAVVFVAAILVRQNAAIRNVQRLPRHLPAEVDRDPLTGLATRRTAYDALAAALAEAARGGQPVAVGMIDVDDFKQINDRWGHPTGDAVLRLLAASLTRSCRATDVAARYGGDEFLLILPGVDGSTVVEVAGRLTADLGRRRPLVRRLAPGSTGLPTLSIGIAATRAGLGSAQRLVALADAAMYDVKRGGKNGLVVVDADAALAPAGRRSSARTARQADSLVPPRTPRPRSLRSGPAL